ncbi:MULTISPECIES: hypothetical protein [Streptomyces violaceusniger group]|uniref:hypothetical protein n=1 Tax=Streptomyces violaceusniger group TaxID=2839105 RepID=UPI000A3A001E|nr:MULTISPECIES: hypothetical protein [Streptomyces violaceusniger group]
MTDRERSTSALLLAEYAQIKDEQRARIGFRDNLLYVTLAAVTAVAAVAAQTDDPQLILALALPVVCLVLGWTHLVNDEKISAIGRYVRTELASRLAEVTNVEEPLFGWETYHRSDDRRISRKTTQTVVDLLAFLVTPFAALITFWCHSMDSALLVAVSILEAAGLIVLGVLFLQYAER